MRSLTRRTANRTPRLAVLTGLLRSAAVGEVAGLQLRYVTGVTAKSLIRGKGDVRTAALPTASVGGGRLAGGAGRLATVLVTHVFTTVLPPPPPLGKKKRLVRKAVSAICGGPRACRA